MNTTTVLVELKHKFYIEFPITLIAHSSFVDTLRIHSIIMEEVS